MRYFVIFLIFLACSQRAPKSYDKIETKRYVLLNFDPPKHFYVDLEDVETKKVYQHVYVSKHCNDYRQLKIGKIYELKRYTWTHEGTEYTNFDNCELQSTFCNSCN